MKKKLIRIGFSFNISKGSASNFLNSLRVTLKQQKIAKTSYFINPLNDCNIFANKVRNIYNKPFYFRVDGIAFDLGLNHIQKTETNDAILFGLQKSKGVIFQSNFAKELCFKTLDSPVKNYKVIINGVDLKIFTDKGLNKRKELNIEEDALVFVTSAKWRTHKRLEDIINTFNEYNTNNKQTCYLIIIGTDGLSYNKNKNIIFIDRIEREEMPAYLRTANIFLFYSWLDNCPNSVIEAIACKIPVICTNQGGTKEIIEATNGGIIVKADAPFLFKEIDLYHPPKPNYKLLLEAIDTMVNNLDYYTNCIDTDVIDINNTAKAYSDLIEETIEK